MISLPFLSSFTLWAPRIGQALFLALVIRLYLRREEMGGKYNRSLLSLGLSALIFWVLYAIFLTIIQYWVWIRDPIGSILLEMPLQNAGDFWFFEGRLNYFLFYFLERNWLNLFESVF